jgi:thiol-disulfide isomerase/thioredoxin
MHFHLIRWDANMAGLALGSPEFPKGLAWINVEKPVSLEQLRGSIVILDFWTYCCINCIHMLPVLSRIEARYAGKHVVVLGVHSAKFDNERNEENIRNAVARYGVRHPVLVDNEMRVWRAFGVSAWPTLVIISPSGRVVHREAGETSFESLSGTIDYLISKYSRDRTLYGNVPEIARVPEPRSGTLLYPGKLSFAPGGKLFAISDSNHNRILVVETATGRITEKIGTISAGNADGDFQSSSFSKPQGVLWKDNDLLFVADTSNNKIRRIDLASRTVSTIAGAGNQSTSLPEVGTKGGEASLNSPWDLAASGEMLYIAMAGAHQVYGYDLSAESFTFKAGNGRENLADGNVSDASFAQPSGISADGGELYVADSEASAIRSISLREGFVSTLVGLGLFVFGNKDGSLPEARLQHPMGVHASGGSVYIADTYNNSIRTIDLAGKRVSTLVSAKSDSMCRFDDPECDKLGLYEPSDVKIGSGKAYIVDTNNHLVRTYDLRKRILETLDIKEKE